ncbi:MAG: anti-sigma factor antagonist [Eubacterium sp.]|nr:anti-sigma factor antagonist [Eubacterium sp.]
MKLNIIHGDKYLCAAIGGDIDHHTASEIRIRLDGEIERTLPSMLILDLSEVDFCDSSGIGLILGRQRLMESVGGSLAVKNPSPTVHKLLMLAGLSRLIITREDKENGKKDV